MIPKLISFAKKCAEMGLDILVQEDNAAPHAHRRQAEVYSLYQVHRMLWPGNSPDLNAIEPCWWWMKRRTTARGAPASRKEAEKAWTQAWEDLPQKKIQEWIERIPHHIKQICQLEGGNEYPEGRASFKRSWKGLRVKGKLSRHAFLSPLGKKEEEEVENEYEDIVLEDGEGDHVEKEIA
jgi:transposase